MSILFRANPPQHIIVSETIESESIKKWVEIYETSEYFVFIGNKVSLGFQKCNFLKVYNIFY